MSAFKEGDKVYHKSGEFNQGLGMDVTGINGDKVRCEWFEGRESVHKMEWFDEKDVVLVKEIDGGFRKEGE